MRSYLDLGSNPKSAERTLWRGVDQCAGEGHRCALNTDDYDRKLRPRPRPPLRAGDLLRRRRTVPAVLRRLYGLPRFRTIVLVSTLCRVRAADGAGDRIRDLVGLGYPAPLRARARLGLRGCRGRD